MQQAMGRAFRDLHVLIPEVLIKPFYYFRVLLEHQKHSKHCKGCVKPAKIISPTCKGMASI
jgi:hypothetical protein